jgi:hypothetical protein
MGNFDPSQNNEESDRLRQLMEDRKRAVGFSATPVLPGEHQAQFDRLLKDLRLKYEPEGPAEDDAVETMANCVWRKRHLEIFQRAAEARARWGIYFSYPNDQGGFTKIMLEMLQDAAKETERLAKAHHNGDIQTDKNEGTVNKQTDKNEIPVNKGTDQQAEFSGIYSDLGAAVKISDVMKNVDGAAKDVFGTPTAEALALGTHVSNQIMLAMQGDLITPECFIAELRMIEVLDRTIERSHDRLMKMKKASKANPALQKRVSPLIPDWAARRR